MDDNAMLKVGTVLRGIYRIDDYLASGGFGNTYLATNLEFDEQVAIKEFFMKGVSQRNDDMSSISVSNSENVEMFDKLLSTFKREAKRLRMLGKKKSEHIITVYDIFEENNTAYYVMQYIKGKSLSALLKEQNKPFEEEWLMNGLLPQILEALDVIHKNEMWHLDIKPNNIMLDEDGNASLIDFGSSKQLDTSSGEPVTLSSTLSFTKTYAPFELQQFDYKKIGPWTDIYSLGATIYNLATNQKPPGAYDILNEGLNAFKFNSGTSEKFKNLVLWMMSNKPEDRPQSVEEISEFIKDKNVKPSQVEREQTQALHISQASRASEETIVSSKSENKNINSEDNKKTEKATKSKKRLFIGVGSALVLIAGAVLAILLMNSKDNKNYRTINCVTRWCNKTWYYSVTYNSDIYIKNFDPNGLNARDESHLTQVLISNNVFRYIIKKNKSFSITNKNMVTVASVQENLSKPDGLKMFADSVISSDDYTFAKLKFEEPIIKDNYVTIKGINEHTQEVLNIFYVYLGNKFTGADFGLAGWFRYQEQDAEKIEELIEPMIESMKPIDSTDIQK